jgi:ribonuclease P protein component
MTSLDKSAYSEGNKFPREERLKSKKNIEELFDKGSSVYLYPFRLFFLKKADQAENFHLPQILISIPKRNFKKSVDRNRLKRQIREAYRLNRKKIFCELDPSKLPSYVGILYTSKEKIPYKKIEEKLILILERLKN